MVSPSGQFQRSLDRLLSWKLRFQKPQLGLDTFRLSWAGLYRSPSSIAFGEMFRPINLAELQQ